MKRINAEKLNGVLSERLAFNLETARTAGTELAVFQSGKEICHLTDGWKDYDKQIKLTRGCLYRLASMTKPITAVAALLGVQNGWFDLNDRLCDHLPEFSDMKVAADNGDGTYRIDHDAESDIRIYQCLSHCNGIFAETPLGNMIYENTPKSAYTSLKSMVEYTATQPLAFDPGTYTAYTGYASFDAVMRIIELKSGMSYEEFIRKYIFEPLGIKDITFHPTKEQWDRMVSMHDRTDGKSLVTVNMGKHIFESNPLDYTCAGAGLAGSLEDYSKFALMLCSKGSYNGIRVLDEKLVEEMKTARVPDDIPGRNPNDSWGIGVRVKVHEDWLPEGVFGWSGAYGTHFWVDYENEIVGILLRNMRWYDTHGCGMMGEEFEKDVMRCLE